MALNARLFGAETVDLESDIITSTSDTFAIITSGLNKFTLNGYRILTTQDVQPSISLAPIGATPNADGATITNGQLALQPANASFGGVVTTGTQSFSGQKTFSNAKINLFGTKDNLPPDPNSNNDEIRIVAINATTGELSCYPAWSGLGTVSLNTGTITSQTNPNPDIYLQMIGYNVNCGIFPSGSNASSLITGITGSPTILDLTGSSATIDQIFQPGFDVSVIIPFINNGVPCSALLTVGGSNSGPATAGKVRVQLIPVAVFTPPFGLGTINTWLSWGIWKS